MIQLLSLLIFLGFSTPAHPVSRAQLMKMLQSNNRDVARAAEQISAAPSASSASATTTPKAADASNAPVTAIADASLLPPLPEKPLDLTREQSLIWDKIDGMRPRLQKVESFARAAEELEDLIDGKIVGTDPGDIIAQRAELQQLLLHTMMHALTKKDLVDAKTAGTIDAEYLLKSLKAGRLMHEELFDNQWVDMELDKGSMQAQLTNVADRYASFTDQALSPAEADALGEFEKMSDELNKPVVAAGSGVALIAAYAALKKADVFKKSKKARDLAAAMPVEVGAFTDPKDHEASQKVYDDLYGNTESIFVNDYTATKEQEDLQKGLQDLGVQNMADISLAQMTATIAALVYKTPKSFNDPRLDPTTLDRTLNPELFVVGGKVAMLHRQLMLLNKFLQDNPTVLTGETEPRLRPFLYLPKEFFAGDNIEKLSKEDRYALVSAGTTIITTLKKHRGQLQLKDTYGDNTLESLSTAFDDLSTAGGQDKENYAQMLVHLRQVKVATTQLLEKNHIAQPAIFRKAKDDDGNIIEFQTLFGPNTPESGYTKSLELLVSLLTQKSGDIIGNIKVHTTLLSPSDLSIAQYDIPQLLRNTFDERTLQLTNDYFSIRDEIRRQVTMHTGQVFASPYKWSSTEQEALVPITVLTQTIYQASVTFVPKAQPNIFSSSKKVSTMLTAMDLLAQLLNNRADIKTAMHESTMLRKMVYDIVTFPNAFFDQSDDLKAIGRYRIAASGDGMIKALLKVEQEAPKPDTEKVATLERLRQKFEKVALAEPAEEKFYQDFKSAMRNVLSATTQLGEEGKYGDTRLQAEYTQNMIKMVAYTDTKTERMLIGYCHLVHAVLFNDEGLVITDIPEGLSKEGKLAVREFLARISDNPKELNYADDSNMRDVIEDQLRSLLEDMNSDDRTEIEKLPPAASELQKRLSATFANLGSKETFAQAALELYQALAGDDAEDKREIVGENEVVYTSLFSTKGVFRLPEGVSIADPAHSGMDPVACSAGLQLFEYLQENPRDLGWKDDKMVKALLKRFIKFFKVALKGEPKSSPAMMAASSNGISIPEELTDIAARQMYVFIVSQRDNLKNASLFETFVSQMANKLNSKEKRQFVRDNPQLALALLSQDQGVLIDPTQIPVGKLLKKAVEAGIDLYEAIVKNPRELGYKAPKDEDDKEEHKDNPLIMNGGVIENQAKNVLALLLKRKMVIEKKGDKPEKDPGQKEAGMQKFVRGSEATKAGTNSTLLGGRENPETVIGPRLTNEYLIEKGAGSRQLEIYNYIYDRGFVHTRSSSMRVFADTLNDLKALTTELDKDEWLESAGSRVNLWRPLDLSGADNDTEQYIEKAFHATVFVDYLPRDAKEGSNDALRRNCYAFYAYMYKNKKDFELKALPLSQCKRIMGWLMSPASAPTILESRMAATADPLLGTMLKGNMGALALSAGGAGASGMNPMMLAAMGGMGGKGGMKGGMNPMMAAAMMGGAGGGASGGGMDPNMMMMMMMMQNQGGGGGGGGSEINELRAELNKDKIEDLEEKLAALSGGGAYPSAKSAASLKPVDAVSSDAPESKIKGKWVRKKDVSRKDIKNAKDLAQETGVPYDWALQHDWVSIEEAFVRHGATRFVLNPYWELKQTAWWSSRGITFGKGRRDRIRKEQKTLGTKLFRAVYSLEVPTGEFEAAANDPEELKDLWREYRISKEKDMLGESLFETLYGQDAESNGDWDPITTSWVTLFKKQEHASAENWKKDAAEKELESYRRPALLAYARKMNEKHSLKIPESSFRRLTKLWELSELTDEEGNMLRRVLDPFWDKDNTGFSSRFAVTNGRKSRISRAKNGLGDQLFEVVYGLYIPVDEYASTAGDQQSLIELLRKYRVKKEKTMLGNELYHEFYTDNYGGVPDEFGEWDPAKKDWSKLSNGQEIPAEMQRKRNVALIAYTKKRHQLGHDQLGRMYKHFKISAEEVEDHRRQFDSSMGDRQLAAPDRLESSDRGDYAGAPRRRSPEKREDELRYSATPSLAFGNSGGYARDDFDDGPPTFEDHFRRDERQPTSATDTSGSTRKISASPRIELMDDTYVEPGADRNTRGEFLLGNGEESS